MKRLARIVLSATILSIAGCAARPVVPPAPAPRPSVASSKALAVREGLASYYGEGFDGKVTASGARFNMKSMVAAHPSYPFGTIVRVTNLANSRTVQVRVLDRGPASGPRADGVIIDVSQGAAQALGFVQAGRARVRLEVLRWGH